MIILLGKGGQLGRAFLELCEARGLELSAWDFPEMDLSRPEELVLTLQPGDLVLNCAAYTQVDAAETDEEVATRINGTAVERLAKLCADQGARLVHYSTDYVFDGHATSPYEVSHPRAPVNAYGRSKAVGEIAIEESSAHSLLIRTSWVYAPWGKNFVLTMKRLMQERDSLKVVADQVGRPTHVRGLAERTMALVECGAQGVFHVTDGGECSWHGFALAIREQFGFDCEVLPCSTEEYPTPARRPAYSVLSTKKADALLGESPEFQHWLKSC